MDRREFLKLGALAAAGPTVAAGIGAGTAAAAAGSANGSRGRADAVAVAARPPSSDVEEATIAELQDRMTRGRLTSRDLVQKYLDRIDAIDRRGARLNSVIEVNPDAGRIARELDRERRDGRVRGPLHGIPILLKDNVDTADATQTASGSLALVGAPATSDATVAGLLRAAGAVILGKAGLSEWANFRGFGSSSGWSGRGGQVNNPYVLDRNPCGSSSGSGAATAASLCAAAIATETDGSIVCPAHANGVVGIKPTVGLTSRAGVVPISASQDTVGPHGRTVADAAAVLGAIASVAPDPRDPATASDRDKVFRDYTQFLAPDGLRGARIGVARNGVTGYSEETDAVYEENIAALSDAGAIVVDPADIPTIDQINAGVEEITVLVYEFRRDLNAYLATRTGVPVGSMADVIQFNLDHFDEELKWFGQQWFEISESQPYSDAEYLAARAEARRIGGPAGIDAVLEQFDLDAIVAPTGSPAWPTDLVNGDHFLGASSGPAAVAGYPLVTVPAGDAFGLPLGLTFMGTAYSEPTLVKLAHGFEQATHARTRPGYLPTLPTTASRPRPRPRPRPNRTVALPEARRAGASSSTVICHL
jgi:amidase